MIQLLITENPNNSSLNKIYFCSISNSRPGMTLHCIRHLDSCLFMLPAHLCAPRPGGSVSYDIRIPGRRMEKEVVDWARRTRQPSKQLPLPLHTSLTSHWPECGHVSTLVYKGSWKNVAFILDSHMPSSISIESRRKQILRRAPGTSA